MWAIIKGSLASVFSRARFIEFCGLANQWLLPLVLFCSLVFCWVLEALLPLVAFDYRKWRHVCVNTLFLSTSALVTIPLLAVHTMAFVWLETTQFGLLNLVALPVWVELLVALMALDLIAQYGVHVLLHRVKWLWRMHMVHHDDTHVDATTGFRHHPVDAFTRSLASLVAVLLFGIPIEYYLFYRLVTLFFAYATHANFKLPQSVDKMLSYVLVSPDMHKFHHHFERPWTDSNFGNIFSFWDRMFGTLVYADVRAVQYGLDVIPEGRDEEVLYQFVLPFDQSIKTDERTGWFG